jgi:ubiquinone/menaquinone biosynthesis C-methylase UbiE
VDADLWNEHLARYAFAARLSRRKHVLEIGCGSGYGAIDLNRVAQRVTALDVAADALEFAHAADASRQVEWVQGSATALPFAAGSFQLIIAFEVIEHVEDWRSMLGEVRRLLAPGGQFIVSTPNKDYYAESRKASGPNPFHHHEFEFDEFRDELLSIFPHVSLFTQNHAEGIVFTPVSGAVGAETFVESAQSPPAEAHFFIAVCALDPQTGAPSFVYIPRAGNVLREREQHIARLESELEMKNTWLTRAHDEHQHLVEIHRLQKVELEKSNDWAAELDNKLRSAGARIVELQDEVARNQAAASQRIAELEAAHASAVQWAKNTDEELARCAELLDRAENTVVERTNWAMSLDAEKQALVAKISASFWHKLGRALRVGPRLQER